MLPPLLRLYRKAERLWELEISSKEAPDSSSCAALNPTHNHLATVSAPPRLLSPLLPTFVVQAVAQEPVASVQGGRKVVVEGGGGRWEVLRQTKSSAGTAREAEVSSMSPSSPSPLRTHAPFSRPMTAPARQMSFQVQLQQQPADHPSIPSPSPTSPPLAHHHPLLQSLTKGLSCPLNCNHMVSRW
jgi:hypothetical protein